MMRHVISPETRLQIVSMAHATLFDDSAESAEAREYVFKKRCITEGVARKFRLGYVPKRVVGSGVPGRLILPLHDQHGRLIALTTRDWRPDAHNRGHWHESFEKKFFLYGYEESLEKIKSSRTVVVVEGQFDVLRLHAAGVCNAIGLLGSKASWFQIALMLRHASRIRLALDNDDAGRVGVKGFFQVLKETGMSKMPSVQIDFVKLDGAKDADEFIQKFGEQIALERFNDE